MTQEQKLIEVVGLVQSEDGLDIETTSELLGVSEKTAGKRLRKATEAGLLERHFDEDGYFVYELSKKGEGFLSQKKSEGNPKPKGVSTVAKLSFEVDDEIADEIREIAEEEGLSVSSFLEELVVDALDEFYVVDESEDDESEALEG